MNRHCFYSLTALFVSAGSLAAQTDNESLGNSAGSSITTGDRNVLLGDFSGEFLTTSSENTMVGAYSGSWINRNTSSLADKNVLLGFRAGAGYTQAEWDEFKFFGNALPNLGGTPTYDKAVFIGWQAGLRTRSGSDSTFIGHLSGWQNSTGHDNTFIGEQSGAYVTDGDDNTFIGEDAGAKISTGSDNVAIGNNTLGGNANSTPDAAAGASYSNTAVGTGAGYDAGTSSGATVYHSTFVGREAGTDNGRGFCNTFIGSAAGSNNEYSDYNTFVGMFSGFDNNRLQGTNDANRNTYLGTASGAANRVGSDNVAIGAFADYGNWTAPGASLDDEFKPDSRFTMSVSVNGTHNSTVNVSRSVMLGSYATARRNDAISIGYHADAIQERSIAIGSDTQATHDDAIVIGYQAASHGADIAVIGNGTTASIDPGADGVTALGSSAYRYTSVHAEDYQALADAATPAAMTFVADTGAQDDDSWRIQAADSGAFAISSFATGSYVDIVSADNNGDVTVAGDLLVNSDERLKQEIQPLENALDKLSGIQGKTYTWKEGSHRDQGPQIGLLAQEVEQQLPELVSTNPGTDIKSVNYNGFVPVLINAVDELKDLAKGQQEEISLLRQQLAQQQQLIEALKKNH